MWEFTSSLGFYTVRSNFQTLKLSDAMAIWQCFPWTEMIYPQAPQPCCKRAWFFSFGKLVYSLKISWKQLLVFPVELTLVDCCLSLPYSATLYIQELYVTANIQMPSLSYSCERQIGNTVNYFSLTFCSQDRLLFVKVKHYALMMILHKRKCEQISQIFPGSQVFYRYFFLMLNT